VSSLGTICLAEHFWPRVAFSDGCWEWTGSRDSSGYGQIGFARGVFKTNRVAWNLAFGIIPAGLQVLHRCDNPPCVRPSHLFLGTQADNIADMNAKGRARSGPQLSGYRSPRACLSEAQVAWIRAEWATGTVMQQTLALQFGVSETTIHRVVRGKRGWAA
jgi:hypothetical protein